MMQSVSDASKQHAAEGKAAASKSNDDSDTFHDAVEASDHQDEATAPSASDISAGAKAADLNLGLADGHRDEMPRSEEDDDSTNSENAKNGPQRANGVVSSADSKKALTINPDAKAPIHSDEQSPCTPRNSKSPQSPTARRPVAKRSASGRSSDTARTKPAVSEWSHQLLAPQIESNEPQKEEEEWQNMPAFAKHTIYDDDTGKVIADELPDELDDGLGYGTLGGAAKGYTRIQVDEDAQSATSMDDNTAYLFSESKGPSQGLYEDDEDARDALAQMQTNKMLLTEGQRIAYVGVVRLAMFEMLANLQSIQKTRGTKKEVEFAAESMILWSQKMMVRLYGHMEVDTAEQVMIEQLADHGLQAGDLTPTLMVNARVKNPSFDDQLAAGTSGASQSEDEQNDGAKLKGDDTGKEVENAPGLTDQKTINEPGAANEEHILANTEWTTTGKIENVAKENDGKSDNSEEAGDSKVNAENDADIGETFVPPARASLEVPALPPPPYSKYSQDQLKDVQSPSDFSHTRNIDIDIRWTVLCDLFLVLISDSNYDSRSRVLLERVGNFLQVPWVDICRFEKRVADALEMEEEVSQENWDEKAHMEKRRKEAMRRRLMFMGLATVGGSLVIGLSAGLLAPVIGAGLAAGFTTIGVTGTGTFLAGAGGAALVTTTGVVTGGTIAVRASSRRTGAVKTFEYRPLHNNKRVNLIVTIAGWMTGKIDDVRLPFSTVDPIMGDIYSVHWEPEMLRSMGDTINILATEALTQGLQQILGSTILVALMAALQLPIVLTKLSYLIDNPWAVSLARADQAGLILADSLIERNLGLRPITLVGFSIGCRLIFTALKEMAKRGAIGVVQNVYLFGSPIVIKKDEFLRAKTIVSGRFVNGYAINDWILGYLFRATGGGIMPVAGLTKVDIPGIENFDVTEEVPGHMSYRAAMPKLLRKVGWQVESDEFTEIEDPDPENHEKRQRELINEIDEARKELEQKAEKKRFGIFSINKKKLEKKSWETYDERMKGDTEDQEDANAVQTPGGLLFDVDAIRAEAADLAAQGFQIKQLESTMPAMKIDMNSPYPSKQEAVTHSAPQLLPRQSDDQFSSPSPSRSLHNVEHEEGSPSPSRGEENISMSFEAPQRTSMGSLTFRNSKVSSRQPSPVRSPPFLTSPISEAPDLNTDRNVWADDEENEYGREKELQMTFE